MRPPDRWFTLLVRILPRELRARHGEEMVALCERMKDELGPSPSRLALLRLRLAVTWDLLRQLPWRRQERELVPQSSLRLKGTSVADALSGDLRFAVRHFLRRWGTTLTMLALLTLGMGVGIVIFSYVHSYAALPPPGIEAIEGLVRIRGSQDDGYGGRSVRPFSREELADYRGLTTPFDAVAGWADAFVTVDLPGMEVPGGGSIRVTFVTDRWFEVLGVRPLLGPGLPGPPEASLTAAPIAVISHVLWDRLFGRSPDVIGKTVSLNGVPVTLVGVTDRGFVGIGGGGIWLPLASRPTVLPGVTDDDLVYRAVARLRPGVSEEAATAAVQSVAARVVAEGQAEGEDERRPSAEVVPLLSANGDPMHERDVRLLVLSLGLLGVLVLLITCTNVSALLTGLATVRRQEIAVRLSLGAPRLRIVRQLLTESTLLALVAGACALTGASLVLDLVNARVPGLPFQLGVTWPAVVFAWGAALAVGVVFGLAPALNATRTGISGALRDSAANVAGKGLRLQRLLVVAQIAFAQPLLVGVVALQLLVLQEFRTTRTSPVADQLVSVRLLPASGGGAADFETSGSVEAEIRRLLARLEESPEVARAIPARQDVGDQLPYAVHPDDLATGGTGATFRLEAWAVGPGYFSTVATPLARGRDFLPDDPDYASGGEVPAVIDEALARRLWPGADPLGRRLLATDEAAEDPRTLVVIGVTEATPDAHRRDPRSGFPVYMLRDLDAVPTSLLLRTRASDAVLVLGRIREIVREEAPSMRADVHSVAAMEDRSRRDFQLVSRSLGSTTFVALFLSAIGLYAVVAFSVRQRSSEIAVRMAIGAPAERIAGGFVLEGLRLSALGLAIGLPAALIGLRLFEAVDPFGIPEIPLVKVTVLGVLGILTVAVGATLIPARWAAGVEPAGVLRR